MDPLTLMAIMSAVKMGSDTLSAGRQRKLAAATQRLSPWTGLQAQPVNEPDYAGTAMQAVGTGLAMKQGQENQELQKKLTDAQTRYYDRMSMDNMQNNDPLLGMKAKGNYAGRYTGSPWDNVG